MLYPAQPKIEVGMKPNIHNFLDRLNEFTKASGSSNRYRENPKVASSIAEHLVSLSPSDFKKLISDRYWNSYPTYITSYGEDWHSNPRRFFNSICSAVKLIIYSNDKLKNELIKNSEGIFRISTIRSCLGKDKLKASKIALKSGDVRVRKLAVGIVPIRDVERHLGVEKSEDVKLRIEKRIGYLNMLDHQINSSSRWYRSRAIANCGFDQDFVRDHIQKKKAGGGNRYYDRDVFASMVYNVDHASAAFYLDIFKELCSSDDVLKQAFLSKLAGKIHG